MLVLVNDIPHLIDMDQVIAMASAEEETNRLNEKILLIDLQTNGVNSSSMTVNDDG